MVPERVKSLLSGTIYFYRSPLVDTNPNHYLYYSTVPLQAFLPAAKHNAMYHLHHQ